MLAAVLVVLAGCTSGSGQPRRTSVPLDPADRGRPRASPEKVFRDEDNIPGAAPAPLQALDGTVLLGKIFYPGRSAAVVLAPPSTADQTAWFSFAQRLADADFSVLPFDFRGHGRSEGERNVQAAPEDVELAVDFLELTGSKRIAVVGAGMGGTAAVVQAGQTSLPVRAVVAIDAGPRFEGLDASEAARRVDVPTLVVSTNGDGPRELAALIRGADLQTARTEDPVGDARVQQLVFDFLRRELRP